MPDLLIEVSCNAKTCGNCECKDKQIDYCGVFQVLIEDDLRVKECIDSQSQAEVYTDFCDSYM